MPFNCCSSRFIIIRITIEGIALVIAVDTDINDAQMLGIQSVPTFVVNCEFGVSGAQKEEYFLNMLHDTYNKMHPTKLNITDDGSACGPDGCDI
ncbi:MAG TPA: hypothetical protein GX742_00885 [Acholeplasmataceae bacterium]|nr:hypothetical protein [Acholeplasmataceae bacterium]